MGGRRRVLVAAIGLTLVGCTGPRPLLSAESTTTSSTTTSAPTTSSTSTTTAAEPDTTWVAEAQVPEVAVFDEPDTPEPSGTVPHPTENGVPLVFLLAGPRTESPWVEVFLPYEPGATGWIRSADVVVVRNTYRITIELGAHLLTVTNKGVVELQAPIAVGVNEAPDPEGVYFIKELLRLPDPDGFYGTYAYGLSGYSTSIAAIHAGTGVVGIHGTNDPSLLGADVEGGSIAVANEVVDQMAGILPLGTPVEIRP